MLRRLRLSRFLKHSTLIQNNLIRVIITVTHFSTMASSSPSTDENEIMTTTPSPVVNLLDLAAACVACTETASTAIQKIVETEKRNTRLKADGSFVTDADFAAQGVIVQAVRHISEHVQILGEESAEEMAAHIGQYTFLDEKIHEKAKLEVRMRYHGKLLEPLPLAQSGAEDNGSNDENNNDNNTKFEEILADCTDPEETIVDASRVGIIVDPLDGTKSYAHGEYDAVSILIAIMLDEKPYFGVIGKPFGYLPEAKLSSMLNTPCVTIYGGPLLNGVYVAGGKTITPTPIIRTSTADENTDSQDDLLPRAVISSSRSNGVVEEFCIHLGEHGLIHKDPMLISGAGEKSLRLILQINNEALWFYPKGGTSLWDVAAPDAMLRSLGGKLTDKYGNDIDYNKPRSEAENVKGIVACIDKDLHAKCIQLFSEGDWISRR